MRNNNKGFTLVEVILSIALLGLLAVGFIPSFGNYMSWMVSTRDNITKASFVSQGEMEVKIYELKDALSKGEEIKEEDNHKFGITKKLDSIKLFSSEFNDGNRQYPEVYQIENSPSKGIKHITWVGDERLPVLPVPVIEAKSLSFQRNNVDLNSKYQYSSLSNLILKGSSEMLSNPSNSAYRHRYDWYVSKPGFIVPLYDVEEDYNLERVLPKFPDDYVASPIFSELGSANLNVVFNQFLNNDYFKSYSGRHILFTVTPFAKSLKKGYTSSSLPIYIYGPNYIDNLVMHLDASTLDLNDQNFVLNNDFRVINWKSSSPNTNLSAIQAIESKMPFIVHSQINEPDPVVTIPFQGGLENPSVWGRALGNLDANMSSMKISGVNLGTDFNLFIILRKVDIPLSPELSTPIIRANRNNGNRIWSLDWMGELQNPRLSFSTGSNKAELASTLELGDWYLIQATAQSANLILEANSLKKDSEHNLNANGAKSLSQNTTSIDINWNGVEIAEILVYNGNINTADLDSVKLYLINKYNPSLD